LKKIFYFQGLGRFRCGTMVIVL